MEKICPSCLTTFVVGNTVSTGKNKKCCSRTCSQRMNGQSYAKKNEFTLADFIKRSRAKHGDAYLYERSIYTGAKNDITITCPKHGDFVQKASQHYLFGCRACGFERAKNVSIKETQWLDSLGVCERQKYLSVGGEKMFVDGYDTNTNTVYLFHGDFWHGNPKRFDQTYFNSKAKKTCGELYEETLRKDQLLRDSGYNLVVMWEWDFDHLPITLSNTKQ